MAQGTVKKGFFFYFGLFFLMIFAAFMVCLVIMMFNPGKTVLWMQYFTANTNQYVAKTSDGIDIDYSSITSIKVNSDYANIYVVENNHEQNNREGSGIYVINHAKGFAVAKDAKAFKYDVSVIGNELTIDISENNGFMFFSKDVKIIINGYDKNESKRLKLENLSLNVDASGSSDIYLGDGTNIDDKEFSLSKANIKTANGSIVFGKFFKTNELSGNAVFSSGTGNIKSYDGNANFTNVDLLTLETEKGKINFDNELDVSGKNVVLKNKNGSINCGELKANSVDVYCSQGNFKIDHLTVADAITFENSIDTMLSPIVDIITLDGDLNLNATAIEGNSAPTINITKMNGKLDVLSSRGALNVKEANGKVYVKSTTAKEDGSMNVNINVSSTNTSDIEIVTEKGKIVLGYKGQSFGNATLQTKSDVVVNFTNKAGFGTDANNYSGTDVLAEDRIVTNQKLTEGKKSELSYGTILGHISVLTDAKLYYNLQEKVE